MGGVFSRHNRYLAAIGGLALAAALLVGLSYAATESERTDIETDAEDATVLRGMLGSLTDSIHDQTTIVVEFLLTDGRGSPDEFERALGEEEAATAEMHASATELPELRASLSALSVASDVWRSAFAEPAIEAARGGDSAAVQPFIDTSTTEREELESAIEPLVETLADADVAIRGRHDSLAFTRTVITGLGLLVMLGAAAIAMMLIRRYGRMLERDAVQAGVLNRFTEVTSFAAHDAEVAASNLEALALLAHPDAAVTHVFNRSKDRAVPEASFGTAPADVLPLNALSRCAGMVRGSMYVTDDASAPLSVHCPIYPVDHGTVACVPLNSGEPVGAVHLYWERPNALTLEVRPSVTRIAEHAALSIGNRRLMAALQGQANTDPRTGLANSRAFDQALQDALAIRGPDEAVSVLMLDLDHFKDFNDRHGHPAGDEALRAFAEVLRSCMRDGDVAARYGGEEFAVLLAGVDGSAAVQIAERIRVRTEATLISLAPGITDRITVSIGIGSAPSQAFERVPLLRIADEALYRAKVAGRNRVEHLSGDAAQGSHSSTGRNLKAVGARRASPPQR